MKILKLLKVYLQPFHCVIFLQDIIAGLIFACLLMAATEPFVEYVDIFLMTHAYAVPCLVAVGISLCLMYPSLDKWSTARGDTTLSLAVFSGIYAGLWFTRSATDFIPVSDEAPYDVHLPGWDVISITLLRQTIGVFFIVILLTVNKYFVLQALCKVFGYDPKDPESKKHLVIELPYKYVSYFSVSLVATYIMPLIFVYLGIQRPSFYTEVLLDSYP